MTTETEQLRAADLKRLSEETANMLAHAFGWVLSVVGSVALVRAALERGDAWQIAGACVYSTTLVLLYAASTLSHSFRSPPLRHFFRMLDQVCIFLLIAGTFTPFGLSYLRMPAGWVLLGAMWGLALVGIFFKIFYTRLNNVATIFYVLLGWLPILAIRPILELVPAPALLWMLVGGLFYTVGAVILTNDHRAPYLHVVWHLFVIAGSAAHYIGVYCYCLPAG